uniref:Leucine-rich repeat, immunoglobulin-like domain and transmembrane domain-containing protein 1 n=1 Tax=Anolis carolinensis TaxID=28377 RepID=H9GM88_ANOCA|nr:PREDICTED: leucine-rich repeat, immunoglobulin-like domain and transmembrane domain-containing protein 1 [Anolis carolinensis]|eukprot:XP_003223303.1 PREDICTED: leucine-rich repeat, immunoglobulin-like domain and transmembrane domain-containing protein 1 [Anolis carolinensis]
MWVTLGLVCCLVFWGLPLTLCSCPSQCTCSFHSISDGTKARAVLCNDPEMTLTPVNFPVDTFKVRIEKTAIRRVPGESFHSLHNLEFLWMPYNSLASLSVTNFRGLRRLQELRLDGNALTSFPWDSLLSMPQLRLLDLHNNELASIPADAAQYVRNITYLDVSSNKLVTLPQELIAVWSNLQAVPYFPNDNSKIILGLQDNPWTCDCSLYEMVHFLNFQSPNIAFVEARLKCFAPRSLAGILFTQVELRKCQSPVVHTSVAKVKTILGSTVLLRCGTTGVPIPELSWRRADGNPLNGTVHQEISSDGMSWSILGLPVVSYLDSGEYICKAKNFLGATEAFISLIITESESTDVPSANSKGTWNGKVGGMEAAAYNDNLVARYVITTSTSPTLGARSIRANTEGNPVLQDEAPNMINNPRNLVASPPPAQQEPERIVRSVRVIGDTDHSVTLAWKAPQAKNTTIFSVLYAIFGERDMRRINVEPGKTKLTINDLMPKTKYIVCVCVKGLIPRKEQCIIFSTDEVASAGGTQKLINVVVISVACVIAVPLTLVVCCGALKRRCKKCFTRKPKEIQDSYVTFESLSPGAKVKGTEGEYLTRHTPDESNRLLSARSSVDSEAIPKAEGQPNEYFC